MKTTTPQCHVVTDWSDAEIKGLGEAIGKETAQTLLKGCKVHWSRSWQRTRDRIVTSDDKERERALFSCIASAIPNIEGQKVAMCFQALFGKLLSTRDLLGVVKGFTLEDADFIDGNTNWSPVGTWWMCPDHLRMLHNDFTFMADDVWSRCPENTNAVERKIEILRMPIHSSYVAKYLVAASGNSISYTDRAVMAGGKAAQLRKLQRAKELSDKQAVFGPPDKTYHLKAGTKR